MTYEVHVQGRTAGMLFDSYSTADTYRRVMLDTGKFAWLTFC